MSKHADTFKDLRHESERLLDELELILAKQEAQLKELHIYAAEKQHLPESIQDDSEALIKESEALLEVLSHTLDQQCRELSEQGVDIHKVYTTGHPDKDTLLEEDAKESAQIAQAYAKSKAKTALQTDKSATTTTRKRHDVI
jgi:uncharacterized coiled-coil protein SlyX